MKSHNEFMEEINEVTREPTLAEQTHDALKDDANYNRDEVNKWKI